MVRSIFRSWEIPSPLRQAYLSMPERHGKHVWNVKGHAQDARGYRKHVWNARMPEDIGNMFGMPVHGWDPKAC